MNLKKIVLPFSLLLSLSSCITSHIEDINGKDDYTLATLTHEDVLAERKSYIAFSQSHFNVADSYSESCKKMSGIMVIDEYRKKQETIIEIDFKVFSGNGEAFLISNKEIKSSIKANSIMNYVMNANESYFLMIAGESCHFEIKYSFVRK